MLYQPPHVFSKLADEPVPSKRTTEEPQAEVVVEGATHRLLIDVEVLKNPTAHVSHLGWEVAVPAALVNLPAGHLVWAVQESVFVLLFDVKFLKNPTGHASHWGPTVAEMYLPRGHSTFWCALHESVAVLLFDVKALKNPGGHASHLGSEVAEPAVSVYLPAGHHLVWAVHRTNILGQPMDKREI